MWAHCDKTALPDTTVNSVRCAWDLFHLRLDWWRLSAERYTLDSYQDGTSSYWSVGQIEGNGSHDVGFNYPEELKGRIMYQSSSCSHCPQNPKWLQVTGIIKKPWVYLHSAVETYTDEIDRGLGMSQRPTEVSWVQSLQITESPNNPPGGLRAGGSG